MISAILPKNLLRYVVLIRDRVVWAKKKPPENFRRFLL
jgi:hypothetical protein